MFASLQARLLALVLLLIVAAIAIGALMVGLFRQSATARVGQAGAELERACDAISDAYRFYSAGWQGAEAGADSSFRGGLTTVVQSALRQRVGVEGGIWQRNRGSLAYAYPTYEGSGPKTDLPQAELPRIEDINRIAATEDRPSTSRYSAPSQTLIVTACPLSGPIPDLTAWTMKRVMTFAGRAYRQLMTGLGVLLATVLAAAVLLTRLTLSWSRHINGIRASLSAHDLAELPTLPLTGERELDQIVSALNDAGARLAQARERAQELSLKVATAERLAAIGCVAAGVAHEIRNPIAAMRLKAENALAKGGERYSEALTIILDQIGRLDRLLRRLLNVTEPEQAKLQTVNLDTLLQSSLEAHRELAETRGVRLSCRSTVESAQLDPQLTRLAVDNLLINAIQAGPTDSLVELRADVEADQLVLSVRDAGSGPPADIQQRLFEPFVTGRSDGTGLGLSIVREVAEAHRGSARYRMSDSGTVFEMILPWQPS
jgi:signal transduction histidine kinase